MTTPSIRRRAPRPWPSVLALEPLEDRVLLSAGLLPDPDLQVEGKESEVAAADVALTAEEWVIGLAGGPLASDVAATLGAEAIDPAGHIDNAFVLVLPEGADADQAVASLQSLGGVEFFYPLVARQQQVRFTPDDPLFSDQWHLLNTGQSGGTAGQDVDAPTAWNTVTGSGVVIAIVDDGLQHTHPDLIGQYAAAYSWDFNDNDSDPAPTALDEHGTAVAGVAAASGNNSEGVSGVAPDATLAGLRLIAGPSTDLMEADALSYMNQDIDIYSNSWGPIDGFQYLVGPGTLTEAALLDSVTNGRDGLGNIYVWAGGNGLDYDDDVNYDGYANSRFTIAVAAIDHDGFQSDYSEPGAPLLVSAYSSGDTAGITTTDLVDGQGYASGDYTSTFGGTSSSAPLVSGVIALMLEANPDLTYRDVQHILVESAEQNDPTAAEWDTNGAGYLVNHDYGFGAIDAAAAVSEAVAWVPVGPEISAGSGTIDVSTTIPDSTPAGINSSFTIGEDILIEWVEVTFDMTHTYRGDLEIVLTSPDGTESILAEPHVDSGNDIYGWTFTSARHWGESSVGEWTLRVSDVWALDEGTWNSWELDVYGTRVGEPDLVAVVVDADEPLRLGDTYDVTAQVTNTGSATSAGVAVGLYLSLNDYITTGDHLLHTWNNVGPITSGQTIDLSQSLTLPLGGIAGFDVPNYHWFGLIVDPTDAVTEQSESNNTASDRVYLMNAAPDLLATAMDSQEPLTWGDTFGIDATILNQGDGASTASVVRFYISANDYITTGDVELAGAYSLGAVDPGASVDLVDWQVTLPGGPPAGFTLGGHFFVGMIVDADGDLNETDESNNRNQGEGIDRDRVYVSSPAPDLVGTMLDAEEPLRWGDDVTIDAEVTNQGLGAAGASEVQFYLSKNGYISTSDILLDTVAVGGLGVAQTEVVSHTVTLPGSPPTGFDLAGYGYIGMIADSGGTIAETDEGNNTNQGDGLDTDRVYIMSPAPDLAGTLFDSEEPLRWGNAFTLDAEISNLGLAASDAAAVRFYISLNSFISPGDELLVGDYSLPALAPGATHLIDDWSLTLPATPPGGFPGKGYVYIAMIVDADGDVAETDETNNVNRGSGLDTDRVYVLPAIADLRGASFDVPDAVTWGETIDVSAMIENVGAAEAAASTVGIYLSVNGYISTLDHLLASYAMPGLAGKTSYTPTGWQATLPGDAPDGFDPAGPVWIGMIVDRDNVVVEAEEDDNANRGAGLDTEEVAIGLPAASAPPLGATYRDTSEYLIGDVWVQVVLLESDGSVDRNKEDWTPTEIASVKSEIVEGLLWWENMYHSYPAVAPLRDLEFTVDFTYADNPIATAYEPITRPYTDQSLWIEEVLVHVGYGGAGDIHTGVHNWMDDQRAAHGTDWAYTMFIVDSSKDANGKFSDNYFAYAYLGGPFLVMTYDNNGWGISRMGHVTAHETAHIFYALDEYSGSRSYNDHSGYYNTQNLNAIDDHPDPGSRVASIMAESALQTVAWDTNTTSPTSSYMLGWQDTDGDGVFDVLDVPLTLTGSGAYDAVEGRYEFSGSSSVGTLTNQNPYGRGNDITINTVDLLQYRLDGGAWTDGSTYAGYTASVAQTVVVGTGDHTIEFRTVVDFGETTYPVASNIWSDTFSVAAAPPAAPPAGGPSGPSGSEAEPDAQPATDPGREKVSGTICPAGSEGCFAQMVPDTFSRPRESVASLLLAELLQPRSHEWPEPVAWHADDLVGDTDDAFRHDSEMFDLDIVWASGVALPLSIG